MAHVHVFDRPAGAISASCRCGETRVVSNWRDLPRVVFPFDDPIFDWD